MHEWLPELRAPLFAGRELLVVQPKGLSAPLQLATKAVDKRQLAPQMTVKKHRCFQQAVYSSVLHTSSKQTALLLKVPVLAISNARWPEPLWERLNTSEHVFSVLRTEKPTNPHNAGSGLSNPRWLRGQVRASMVSGRKWWSVGSKKARPVKVSSPFCSRNCRERRCVVCDGILPDPFPGEVVADVIVPMPAASALSANGPTNAIRPGIVHRRGWWVFG